MKLKYTKVHCDECGAEYVVVDTKELKIYCTTEIFCNVCDTLLLTQQDRKLWPLLLFIELAMRLMFWVEPNAVLYKNSVTGEYEVEVKDKEP